jgi:hypothetical protein
MKLEKSWVLKRKSRGCLKKSETSIRALKFGKFLVSLISFKHAAF